MAKKMEIDSKTKVKSEKKVTVLSYKQMTQDLIQKGMIADKVKGKIVNRYVQEGKDEAWAKRRANAIYYAVTKGLKAK